MGCLITNGIVKSCDYSVSGIQRVYITNFNKDTTYTNDTDSDAIATITLGDPTDKYFYFEPLDNTAFFQDDLTVGSNGTKYRTHTVTLLLDGNVYDYNKVATALDLGKFTVVTVDASVDSVGSGAVRMFGRMNGLSATANNLASGTAVGDSKAWTLTLVGTQGELHQILEDESVVTALLPSTTTP
ncbi:MAG: hypothetical protein LBV71_16120 [Prevotella sp.]|jgi:hypothetical protein|nr:hypothetical protein [Prevotella sp.]